MLIKRIAILAVLATAVCGLDRYASTQVKTWTGTITLPTYEEGQPDPNPPFDTYATIRFNYPYTLRTNLTGEKDDHVWRALFLENEYLKCTVLPDIGGHLYTCVDKISGQPMFYANPSIKKAQIGYRGAWAAFGVEYNFPVSHNWVSMSPVDFANASHPDGSASITVGNIDRAYGMQWSVELVLRPGSTLLEQHVTLYNRSDVRHRYYWWSNAGVQVWDDSRIEYPMQYVASHGFTDVNRWPVDAEGKDLSAIRNHTDGPVSFFVHGSHEPFMGIWNPKTQTGVAHFAEYRDLPAKKIWSWGADSAGLDWRKALSDNNSTYVEVQAGLFRNQETYAFLDPAQAIRFTEYWMPVRGTGGISRASKVGVVTFQTQGATVSTALNVNQKIPAAQLSLAQDGVTLWSETSNLDPEKTWTHGLVLKTKGAKLTFELKDRDGKLLLRQTDGEYDWDPETTIKTGHQEAHRIPDAPARSEGDWLEIGTDQELNGKIVLALATYRNGLEKYPDSLSLKVAAGRLGTGLQHFAEAETLLQSAQKRDTSNAEIAYYLGIADEGVGHPREAETAYQIAYRQAALRVPAAIKLGELRAREGDPSDAYRYLSSAVDAKPAGLRANEQLEAVARALGKTAEADELAQRGLAADPTSDFLKEEVGAPDLHHLAADPYRVLRIATDYMDLGLYAKALIVLERTYHAVASDQSEPGSVLPQRHPLVLYYVAYCKSKLAMDARQNWQNAAQLSPNLVFPSSAMDKVVLETALKINDNDAAAHYLLGTLLFSKALHKEGMDQWIAAKRLDPHLRVVDVDLGQAWLQLESNPRRALDFFLAGLQNDPDNAEVYTGLDKAMSLTGASAADRADALSRYPSADAPRSTMPSNLVYQLALTRAEAGQFSQALNLFKDRFFPSEEGGISSGQVRFEIRLMQADAKAKSGECGEVEDLAGAGGDGLRLNGSSAQQYVRLAAIASSCKRAQESKQLLEKAAAGTNTADVPWAIQAQQSLGTYKSDQAQQKLQQTLAQAKRMTETSAYTGWWWYTIGMLQAALHQPGEAKESFDKALLLPDSLMSHHLSRAALANLANGK